tara:strand:- start:36900 stop:37067 length:168 start_codon:yes stop_codon:yes gene_type:complete
MKTDAPQIIILCLYALGLLLDSHLHGQHKSGKHNVFVSIVGVAISFSLLKWGGFF